MVFGGFGFVFRCGLPGLLVFVFMVFLRGFLVELSVSVVSGNVRLLDSRDVMQVSFGPIKDLI